MKQQKKNELVDKAEIVDDPSKKKAEIEIINQKLGEILDIENNLGLAIEKIERNLSREIINDPEITRVDTVNCVKIYFEKIKKQFEIFKNFDPVLREKLYFLIYNVSILIFNYSHKFRQFGFSQHGISYLFWILSYFESNVVLSNYKYLAWRTKLYVELASCYDDLNSYKSAYKTVLYAQGKVGEIKAIEEQEGFLPDYIRSPIDNSFRILKTLELKYGLYSNNYQVDLWKKKIEEYFPSPEDKYNRLLLIINNLSLSSKNSSIINHDGIKSSFATQKQNILQYMFELTKIDLLMVKNGLIEYLEKKKREPEKLDRITKNVKDYQNVLDEYNQKDQNMVKNWKNSAKAVPIELHCEFLKHLYDMKMWKEYMEVIDSLLIRIKYRRVENPYLSEIDIQVSNIKFSNIPNKYQRIPLDLNLNNYMRQIKKLREEGKFNQAVNNSTNANNSGKASGNAKDRAAAKENKNSNNKGKKPGNEDDSAQADPLFDKIENLEHSFVYLLVRKSHNPAKSIIGFRIVFSNDKKIRSQIEENERAVAIPIRTFEHNLYEKDPFENPSENANADEKDITMKILSEANKTTPYLVYRKTSNALSNEEEKLKALTSIFPLISNSPFIEPLINLKKNETELSILKKKQAYSSEQSNFNDLNNLNKNFNNNNNNNFSLEAQQENKKKDSFNFSHNYINICYQTDEVYYIIERECEIIKGLYELENSFIENFQNSSFTNTNNNTSNNISSNDSAANKTKNSQNFESPSSTNNNGFMGLFADKFLNLNFNMEKLDSLCNSLFSAIQGPLGFYFLNERRNILYDICILLWKKYLKDLTMKIDHFYEMENELDESERNAISDKILAIQKFICSSLYNINCVLSNINIKDPVLFSFISSRLADYLEKTENISTGLNILKKSLDYLNEFRENEFKFGMNSQENKHTFTTFTCDNMKIKKLIESSDAFGKMVKEINFKRRKNFRTINKIAKLNAAEEAEEEFEVNFLENEYKERLDALATNSNTNNPIDSNSNSALNNHNNNNLKEESSNSYSNLKKFITEFENNLNCLYVEISVKYYRLYLKSAMFLGGAGSSTSSQNSFFSGSNNNNNSDSAGKTGSGALVLQRKSSENDIDSKFRNSGLAEKTLKKLDIIKGQTATKTKQAIDFLKSSLQEAGKLDPDKPYTHSYEKTMLFSISKNIYLKTLFLLAMGEARGNKQDKKYLLNSAFNELQKCYKEEDERGKYYETNYFYVKAFEKYNKNKNYNMSSFYPFNILYNESMIDCVDKIPEPILVSKTQKTATFICPIVKIKNSELNANHKITNKVSIFGQLSNGSNIVALHNKQLSGAGIISSVYDFVTIRNLKENEKHIFGYAGYDNEDVIINGIGKTSKEVENYFPMPLSFISYFVSKYAFDTKNYEVCKEIGKSIFAYYTEKNHVRDYLYDNKSNLMLFYKLNYEAIKSTCLFELEGIAFIFLYYAKAIFYLKVSEHSDDLGANVAPMHKNILKNLNILLLGLELSTFIRHYRLIKLFIVEAYNLLNTFINRKNCFNSSFSRNLVQILIRLSLAINLVPNDYWDQKLRTVSALISYNILRTLISLNENDSVFKKLLLQEVGLNKRKFYSFNYKALKSKNAEGGEKGKKAAAVAGDNKANKDAKNANNVEASNIIKPPTADLIECESIVVKDIEKEMSECDEFILGIYEFNDVVKIKISQYIANLERLLALNNSASPVQELTAEVEKRKKELTELIETWEGFKAEGIKYLQKYILAGKDSEKFYEFVSKLLKRSLENLLISQNMGSLAFAAASGKNPNATVGAINLGNAGYAGISQMLQDTLKTAEDIPLKESDTGLIQGIYSQKIGYLENDVVFSFKKRIKDFLDKVEDDIKNKKQGSAGNNGAQGLNNNNIIIMESILQSINLDQIRSQTEEKYFGSQIQAEKTIPYENFTKNEAFNLRNKYFWLGDFIFTKAIISFFDYTLAHQPLLNYDFNNFLNYKLIDIKKLQKFQSEEEKVFLDYRNIKELDYNNQSVLIEKNFDNRYKKVNKIYEKLANAILFVEEVKNTKQMDSIIYFTHNLINYDLLTPYDAVHENIWIYLNILSESALKRLEKIKNGEVDFTAADYNLELQRLKNRLKDPNDLKHGVNFDNNISLLRKFEYKQDFLKSVKINLNENNNNLALSQNAISIKDYSNNNNNFSNAHLQNESLTEPFLKEKENINADLNSKHQIKIDEEQLIEIYDSRVNFDAYVELIIYTIQCDYIAQKWNTLANLIQKFNFMTNDHFCEFTLSFLIEAQNKLYDKASENTKNKKTEIEQRLNIYNTWKNSRKKNKRQQMITGEIPQEELDFQRDYAVLSKELYILESIENLLKTDKEKSEKQYSALLNDTNNATKSVSQSRKLLEKYQMEALIIRKDEEIKGAENFEAKNKKKALKVFASNLIGIYKKSIQILKKRQENFMLIQALYEMSLVLYSDGDVANAEVFFNESLDTVFQKLYSLKDFRSIFGAHESASASNSNGTVNVIKHPVERYGVCQLLYAVLCLHKLSKFCYDINLELQRECSLMAAEIIFSILTASMPNPTNLLTYASFRITEINKNSNLFTSRDNLKPTDLLISLIDLSEILISYNDYELVLPVLALAEHIACDVIKSTNYLMKIRILKTIALAELGLISEAMLSFVKILKKVDLPNLYNQNSLYFEKTNGKFANIQKEIRFLNHLTPDNQKNVDTITSFFKLGTGDFELKYLLQANLHSELIYARSLIIFKIFEKENYLNYLEIKPDIAFRLENLSRIEKEIREVIVQLAVSEEINTLVKLKKYLTNNPSNSNLNLTLYSMGNNSNILSHENNFNNTNNKSIVSNNNNSNNINRPDSSALGVSGVDMINKRIEDISNLKKITNEEINNYYLTKNFFKEEVDLRSERFDCIIKSRLLLARIYQAQSLFLNASGIALKGLENNKKFLEFNICGLEQADDFTFDYKQNDQPNKKEAKAPAPKEPAGQKSKGGKDINAALANLNVEEELNKYLKVIFHENKSGDFRPHNNSIYFFKLHLINLISYYHLGRYEDCKHIINKLIENSKSLSDNYFQTRFLEILSQIDVYEFNLESAEKSLKRIKELNKHENIIDPEYSVFLANLAEFYYAKGENEKAIEIIKDSRKIIWKRIAKINFYILNDREGYTKEKIIKGLEIDPSLKVFLNERESSLLAQGDKKKDAAAAAKKSMEAKSDFNPIAYNSILSFKENEFLFNAEKINKEINDSEEGHNIYFRFNDLICRIDLKYLLFQLFQNQASNNINNLNSRNDINASLNLNNKSSKNTITELSSSNNALSLKKQNSNNNNPSTNSININNLSNKSEKEKKLNLDILSSILTDLETLFKTMLYPHISLKVILLALRARLEKMRFLYDFQDFISCEEFTLIAKKNKLDMDVITKETLIRLTNNYSEKSSSHWLNWLSKAKENYEKAITYFKSIPNEFCLCFENLFSLANLFLDLSDVNLYMAEFSPNLNPKFCDVSQIVNKINKINKLNVFYNEQTDELPVLPDEMLPDTLRTEKENYVKERIKKDKILHRGLVKNSIFMIEQSIKITQIRKYILENIHEICLANLIDPSKFPKDLATQIIENDFLNKKRNKNYLIAANITAKSTIDAFDLFNLFKNYMREVEYFTINFNVCDDSVKSISKIHKFLRMNSTNYLNKCNMDVQLPPQDSSNLDDLSAEIVKKDFVYVFSINANSENKFYLNYILGANSANAEYKDYSYGRFVVNNDNLVRINKKLFGLKNAFKNTNGLSEAKRKRDFKYLNEDYIKILVELTIELMKGKKIYTEIKNVENAINKELLGEISLENIEFWFNMVSGTPFISSNVKFNEYLQDIHKKLFC